MTKEGVAEDGKAKVEVSEAKTAGGGEVKGLETDSVEAEGAAANCGSPGGRLASAKDVVVCGVPTVGEFQQVVSWAEGRRERPRCRVETIWQSCCRAVPPVRVIC